MRATLLGFFGSSILITGDIFRLVFISLLNNEVHDLLSGSFDPGSFIYIVVERSKAQVVNVYLMSRGPEPEFTQGRYISDGARSF